MIVSPEASGPGETIYRVGIVGGLSVDAYREPNDVDTDHTAGAKKLWTPGRDDEMWHKLDDGDEITSPNMHGGGNANNIGVDQAYQGCDVAILSVLGTCRESRFLWKHLGSMGVNTVHIVNDATQRPGRGIIARREGEDRQATVSPPGPEPIGRIITDTNIEAFSGGRQIMFLASTKDEGLEKRVIDRMPENTRLVYAPGSSQFRNPESIWSVIDDEDGIGTEVTIFAANETEMSQLFGEEEADDLDEVQKRAEELSERVDYVLWTAGENGMFVSRRKETVYVPAQLVVPLDTLGAGDRTLSRYAKDMFPFLLSDREPTRHQTKQMLGAAAVSVAQLVQFDGAHGDIEFARNLQQQR